MSAIRTYTKEDAVKRLKEVRSQKQLDPNKFVPDKATAGKKHIYYGYILAPLELGEPCMRGKEPGIADYGMDGSIIVKGGNHWFAQRPCGCPRIQHNEECELCQAGFDLLKQYPKCKENEKIRAAIVKAYLGKEAPLINFYFHPAFAAHNPPAINGRVMWMELPQKILKKCEEVLEADDSIPGTAAGIFYDPRKSLPLKIIVTLDNGYNNYESSVFLTAPSPIADTDEEIEAILAQRHYLFDKVEPVNTDQIAKILASLTSSSLDEAENNASADQPSATEVLEESQETTTEVVVETTETQEEAPAPTPAAKPATVARPAGLPTSKPAATPASKPASAPAAKVAPAATKPAPAAAKPSTTPVTKPAVAGAKPATAGKAPAAAPAKTAPVAQKAPAAPKPTPAKAAVAAETVDDVDVEQMQNMLEALEGE